MTATVQLRLMGPEPGESHLFMKWLSKRYGARLATIKLRVGNADLFDRVVATEFSHEDALVRVACPFPEPALSPAIVREALLRRIDGVLLVLASRRTELDANAAVVAEMVPRLKVMGIEPFVALNDSMRGDAKTTLSATAAAAELGLAGSIHETTLGPPRGPIEYDEGVDAAWAALLERSMKPKGSTPYR